MEIKPIENFNGISAGREYLLMELGGSVRLASSVAAALPLSANRELHRIALLSAVHTVNALLGAASAKCDLEPPPADIDMVTDSSGELILRCQHKTPHRWKLDGERIGV